VGNTALMVACCFGHRSTVQLLLERKADVNATNKYIPNVLFIFVVLVAVWFSSHCQTLTLFAAVQAGTRCLMLLQTAMNQ
jgi:ankyrin repeat protein